jgi:hypothetical protein
MRRWRLASLNMNRVARSWRCWDALKEANL